MSLSHGIDGSSQKEGSSFARFPSNPGRGFSPDPKEPCPYLRAAFSIVPEKDMDEAMRRLAELIKEEQNC